MSHEHHDWRKYLTTPTLLIVRMLVTPAVANAMLFQNRRNRALRSWKIKQYADLMRAGQWEQNHPDTIAFATSGDLINGQHRLRALMEAGVSLLFNVAFGAHEDARLTVDAHTAKTLGDRLWISGLGIGDTATDARKTAELAVRMWHGPTAKKDLPSPETIAEFIRTYTDALAFTLEIFGAKNRGRVTTAPVKAVVARAFYHVPHDRLRRFAEVIMSGESDGSIAERNIILGRNWLLEGRYARNSNAAGEAYRRIARALEAYANGEGLKQLKDISYDPFPLPDRSSAETNLSPDRMVSHRGLFVAGGPELTDLAPTTSHIS